MESPSQAQTTLCKLPSGSRSCAEWFCSYRLPWELTTDNWQQHNQLEVTKQKSTWIPSSKYVFKRWEYAESKQQGRALEKAWVMPTFSSLLVSGSQSNASLCGNCWKGRRQRCQMWALMERMENWAVCNSSSEKPAGTKLALALKTWLPESLLGGKQYSISMSDCLSICQNQIKSNSIDLVSSAKNSDLPWRAARGRPATPHSPWWHRMLGTYQSTNQKINTELYSSAAQFSLWKWGASQVAIFLLVSNLLKIRKKEPPPPPPPFGGEFFFAYFQENCYSQGLPSNKIQSTLSLAVNNTPSRRGQLDSR